MGKIYAQNEECGKCGKLPKYLYLFIGKMWKTKNFKNQHIILMWITL